MSIIYSNHAEDGLEERKISKDLVEFVLRNPERVLDSKLGRKIAERVIGNSLLRIVYAEERGDYIIVTAYYRRLRR